MHAIKSVSPAGTRYSLRAEGRPVSYLRFLTLILFPGGRGYACQATTATMASKEDGGSAKPTRPAPSPYPTQQSIPCSVCNGMGKHGWKTSYKPVWRLPGQPSVGLLGSLCPFPLTVKALEGRRNRVTGDTAYVGSHLRQMEIGFCQDSDRCIVS